MAGVFSEIITTGVRSGQIPSRTNDAREWYRNTARDYGNTTGRINERRFVNSDPGRLKVEPRPGNMYMYLYDPKTKDTLPYYDRFPLIFPFRIESDRFWGINFHYLPLPYRAMLMDQLYDTANNRRYDESTKLRINYQILNSASKFRYFKPCVKQYLFSQMQSKFVYIYPSEWDIALFLPLERFSKASKTEVWAQTRKQVMSNGR
jgi:hypothetical protein